jgi:hypothetical protein
VIRTAVTIALAVAAAGCGQSTKSADLQRQTGRLLQAITAVEESQAKMTKSILSLPTDGKSDFLRVAAALQPKFDDLRREVYRHSDFEKPLVDQIRHDEIDHAALRQQLDEIKARFSAAVTELANVDKPPPPPDPAPLDKRITELAVKVKAAVDQIGTRPVRELDEELQEVIDDRRDAGEPISYDDARSHAAKIGNIERRLAEILQRSR